MRYTYFYAHWPVQKCVPTGLLDNQGQVGEWLKPTDCKSVTPCELRRFESFPVHQFFVFSVFVKNNLAADERG